MFDCGQVYELAWMCLKLNFGNVSGNLNPMGRVGAGDITVTWCPCWCNAVAKSNVIFADTTGSGGNTADMIRMRDNNGLLVYGFKGWNV